MCSLSEISCGGLDIPLISSASIGSSCSEDPGGTLKDGIQWVNGPYPSKLNGLKEEGSPSGTTTFSS
jgi:hypothetical protein